MATVTQRAVWLIFFLAFIALSGISISNYINVHECTLPNVPTISSTLFQEYVQGFTVVLFLAAAFAFRRDREKLFIISLIIFAVAFVKYDNGVHIAAIISGTGILWLALGYVFYKKSQKKLSTFDILAIFAFCISIIAGIAFFTLFFTTWETTKAREKKWMVIDGREQEVEVTDMDNPDGIHRKNPCSWIGWVEYVAFFLLFASTCVLVPNEPFYLFEEPEKRTSRQYMEIERSELLRKTDLVL